MDNNTTLTAVASIQEQFNRAVSLDQDTSATYHHYHHRHCQEEEQQELELELFTEFVALMKFSSFHDSTDDDDGDGDDSIVDDDAVKTRNNGTVLVRPMPYRESVRGGQKVVPVVGKTAAAAAVSTKYDTNDNDKINYHPTPLPHAALSATGECNIPSISETVKGRGILMRTSSSSSAPPMTRFANTNTPSRKGEEEEEEEEMNGRGSDSTSKCDGGTSTLVMKIINSNAKFSPIVRRSFNPDLQVTPADRHGSIPPLASAGGVAVQDTNMQPSKTERDEEVIHCRLPTAPTRLTLKQSAGPPKIPTLRKEDNEATSITRAPHRNNTNQDHDNEDKIDDDEEDDEVSGITSSTKKTKNNKHIGNTVVKSPPLVPRKRDLGYYDEDPTLSCTKCSSSRTIIAGNPFFQDERLLLPLPTSKKSWIPPRRPTKKSRLFLIDHPHDDDNGNENTKDDQNQGDDDQDEITDTDHDLHHHPEEGSVATFSLFSSSSSGASIDTLHSCSSPILSAGANSSVITTPAAAAHPLAGQFFTVPTDEQYEDASINIFFTPPRSEV